MESTSSLDMDVIFFLGAGASVNAGVPDTFGFVSKFKESLATNAEQLKACEKILEVLELWRKEQGPLSPEVDVELLLETLERLETKDKDILLKFYIISGYLLSGYALKKPLKDQLKDLIRRMGIVNANEVRYFEPLLSFLVHDKPLDIFSVNYDMAIEQFCNIYKREYVDGFDLYWNPKSFERTDVDIRLYKIHGSILWYKTDRGYYVKLPTKIEGSRTELITGEQAVSLMLYPMRKWDYDEPLLEMLLKMKGRLEKTHFVVVVGYSFRDNHIRRIFWDAGRTNKRLIIVLVSPNSPEIYENKLKDYQIPELNHGFSSAFERDAKGGFDAYLPSALAGRVVYLPYKFEDILPSLNNYLTQLKYAISSENDAKEKEYKGEPGRPYWSWILRTYLDCEYVEKIAEVYPRVDWSKEEFGIALETHFNIFLSYLAVGDKINEDYWHQKLDSYLSNFSTDKFLIEVVNVQPMTRFKMSFRVPDKTPTPISALTPNLANILRIAKRKSKVPNEILSDRIKRIIARLEPLIEHLTLLQNDFSLADYERINGSALPQDLLWTNTGTIDQEKGTLQRAATLEEINSRLLDYEQEKLEKIFNDKKLNVG